MHVEMYFSMFCLCPAAVLKKPWRALLSRSCMDPGVSTLQEHGAGLGRSHCMDSKVEMSMVCSATPQELLSAGTSVALVETVLSLTEAMLCHCQ